MEYFEWLDSQAMEGERRTLSTCGRATEAPSLRDFRSVRIGERQIDMDAPDYRREAAAAAREMLDSDKLGSGVYAGRPLTNLEMHWIWLELKYGHQSQIQLFAKRLLAWIGVSSNGN